MPDLIKEAMQGDINKELFAQLSQMLGADPILEDCGADAPALPGHRLSLRFAVIDPETNDFLGTGEAVSESLADAIAQVRDWRTAPR